RYRLEALTMQRSAVQYLLTGPNGCAVPNFLINVLLAVSLIRCSRIYACGKSSDRNEAVTCDTRARLEFCLSAVCQRPRGTRARDSILAWRRFRKVRRLERCTATREPLCSRSKEDPLWEQNFFW